MALSDVQPAWSGAWQQQQQQNGAGDEFSEADLQFLLGVGGDTALDDELLPSESGLALPQTQTQPQQQQEQQQQPQQQQEVQQQPQPRLQLQVPTQTLPAVPYNPQGGSARVTLPNLAMRHTGAVLKPDLGATPDSWQGYLGRQEPSAPRSAASSDSPVDNTAEAKAERTRARNRTAMKRFRQRQKEKHQDTASRAEQLEAENAQLRSELLQSRAAEQAQLGTASSNSCCAEDAGDWEPQPGWTDFDPRCTLVTHLTALPGPPMRLTREQIKSMNVNSLAALASIYVARTSHLVEPARRNPDGPEAISLAKFAAEKAGLCAFASIHHPRVLHELHKDREPLPEAALHDIVNAAQFTHEQQATLVRVFQLTQEHQKQLRERRREIVGRLQALETKDEQSGKVHTVTLGDSLDCLQELADNTEDMHRLICNLFNIVWGGVCQPIQLTVISAKTLAYGQSPDIWSILAALQVPHIDERTRLAAEIKYTESWNLGQLKKILSLV